MKALSVVEALDVGEQVALGLIPGGIGPVMHQLGFQRMEEALHWRVVQRVGPPAHRRDDGCFGQRRLVVTAGILDAAVGMLDQAGTGTLALDGHQQRRGRQLGPKMVAHGPAHDLTGVQVHDGGHVQPTFSCRNVGQVNRPGIVGGPNS